MFGYLFVEINETKINYDSYSKANMIGTYLYTKPRT